MFSFISRDFELSKQVAAGDTQGFMAFPPVFPSFLLWGLQHYAPKEVSCSSAGVQARYPVLCSQAGGWFAWAITVWCLLASFQNGPMLYMLVHSYSMLKLLFFFYSCSMSSLFILAPREYQSLVQRKEWFTSFLNITSTQSQWYIHTFSNILLFTLKRKHCS